MKIDINAPILPAYSIANIRLGMYVEELECCVDLGEANKDFLGETRFEIAGGVVSIGVHNASNRIFRIGAHQGYCGYLFGKYKPGMRIEKLMAEKQWHFSEEHGGFLSALRGGVICCPDLEDPTFEELEGRYIGEIAVFVLNIDRLHEDWVL